MFTPLHTEWLSFWTLKWCPKSCRYFQVLHWNLRWALLLPGSIILLNTDFQFKKLKYSCHNFPLLPALYSDISQMFDRLEPGNVHHVVISSNNYHIRAFFFLTSLQPFFITLFYFHYSYFTVTSLWSIPCPAALLCSVCNDLTDITTENSEVSQQIKWDQTLRWWFKSMMLRGQVHQPFEKLELLNSP